jgi:hypothetical protein
LILERALLYRGQPVARANVPADVPEWDRAADRFQLAAAQAGKGKRAGRGLDFGPSGVEAPTVVDFSGGSQAEYRTGSRFSFYDDSATELLLLAPDGKLFVRNSRADADAATPRGAARARRYAAWRERLDELRSEATPGGPGARPAANGMPGQR